MGTRRVATYTVVLMLSLAGCGSDSGGVTAGSADDVVTPTVAVTATAAPETTTVSTAAPTSMGPTVVETSTTQAPTTTGVPAPSTTAVPVAGFNPPCIDRRAEPDTAPAVDPALVMFGPLGAAPTLDIALPVGRATAADEPQSSTPRLAVIPGGVLVGVNPSYDIGIETSLLAAVNVDGSIRWVRCLDHTLGSLIVAPAALEPSSVLLESYNDVADGTLVYEHEVISLVDGNTTGTLADLVAAAGLDPAATAVTNGEPYVRDLAIGDSTVLYGDGEEHVVKAGVDLLVRLDLVSMTVSTTAYPMEADGLQTFLLAFDTTDDGALVFLGQSPGGLGQVAVSVETENGWTSDAAALRANVGSDVQFFYDATSARALLRGVDALGSTLWERTDITYYGGEGFQTGISGDVALVAGCTPSGKPDDPCDVSSLYGVDVATGATRWQMPGGRDVSMIDEGLALVTEERDPADAESGGWMMIDTSTGAAIPGQAWDDPEGFSNFCCGDGDYVYAFHDGGVVVAANFDRVRVWLPLTAGPATSAGAPISVTLV